MVESERQPRRPAWKWIDDILMWCGQDIKGVMTTTEERDERRTFVATVLADHVIIGGASLRKILTILYYITKDNQDDLHGSGSMTS